MSYGLFFVWFVCDAWNLSLEMRSAAGRFRNFAGCVLCALLSCFSSHLSPARLWLRPWNRTPPWRTWICGATTSAQMGQRRGVRWGWGRMGSWRGEGSRHRPMKVAVLNLRGAEYFSDNWLGLSRSENQVWNGIPIIWYHMDVVEAETVCACGWLFQILQEV